MVKYFSPIVCLAVNAILSNISMILVVQCNKKFLTALTDSIVITTQNLVALIADTWNADYISYPMFISRLRVTRDFQQPKLWGRLIKRGDPNRPSCNQFFNCCQCYLWYQWPATAAWFSDHSFLWCRTTANRRYPCTWGWIGIPMPTQEIILLSNQLFQTKYESPYK